MRGTILGTCLVLTLASGLRADFPLPQGSTVSFATPQQARDILTRRDDFIMAMSPFDRAGRMKTDKPVTQEEFLAHLGKCVLEWSASEQAKVEAAFAALRPRLEQLAVPFPKSILMIKTNGTEEGNVAYTRSNAIVLPARELTGTPQALKETIAHELYHVLMRDNPDLSEKLKAVIGFVKCDELPFPENLKSRKLTNPDGPFNNHAIGIMVNGQPAWGIPILYASTETYQPSRGGEFFNYLVFQFHVVQLDTASGRLTPLMNVTGTGPHLVDTRQVSGFLEKVGRNTSYIIHPEEILADNFKLILIDAPTPESPDILARIRQILTGTTSTAPRITPTVPLVFPTDLPPPATAPDVRP